MYKIIIDLCGLAVKQLINLGTTTGTWQTKHVTCYKKTSNPLHFNFNCLSVVKCHDASLWICVDQVIQITDEGCVFTAIWSAPLSLCVVRHASFCQYADLSPPVQKLLETDPNSGKHSAWVAEYWTLYITLALW